jgi:hypothetical protein
MQEVSTVRLYPVTGDIPADRRGARLSDLARDTPSPEGSGAHAWGRPERPGGIIETTIEKRGTWFEDCSAYPELNPFKR